MYDSQTDMEDLDSVFRKFSSDPLRYAPDSFIKVGLENLHSLIYTKEEHAADIGLFFIEESKGRITFFNEEFVVWLVPKFHNQQSSICVFIAQRMQSGIQRGTHKGTVELQGVTEDPYSDLETGINPRLQRILLLEGVYNTSPLILKVIDHCIKEIQGSTNPLSCG